MQSLEILIPIIFIAGILVGLIFLRSKREEKRARESGGKLRSVKTADALAGTEPRVEPDLIAQATERARQAADGELSSTIKADPTLGRRCQRIPEAVRCRRLIPPSNGFSTSPLLTACSLRWAASRA